MPPPPPAVVARDVFVAAEGGEARWICQGGETWGGALGGPEVEISRLRENLVQTEERRRVEGLHFEDHVRRVEAERDQCKTEGVLLTRLCEERDSLVSCLQAELSEARAASGAFQRELSEARLELGQHRSTSLSAKAALRQRSRNVQGGVLPGSPAAAIAAAVAAAAAAAGASNAEESTPLRRVAGGGASSERGEMLNRSRLGILDEERAPESFVEICVSVPRALSPDELFELSEQAELEQQSVPPPAPAPLVRLWTGPQPPFSQSVSQQARVAVSRQVSAPYAPAVAPASPAAADQWPSDASRWVGAAPPPPVRILSASPAPAPKKPGSATIPTAANLTRPVTRITSSDALPLRSGYVAQVMSQARLGVVYRR